METFSHLLVNFGMHEDAVQCSYAASKRFIDKGLMFEVLMRDGCAGVFIKMPSFGPRSAPTDIKTYEVIQQFCAGFWYALNR